MNVREFADSEAMECAVADCLVQYFQRHTTTPYAVMLTGGRTPLGVYRRILESTPMVSPFLRVLISDERYVPEASDLNNFAHMKPLLNRLGLSTERVLSVRTELELEDAARDYHDRLEAFLETGEISIGLLGMGDDGHTASLFTDDDLKRASGRYAVAVEKTEGPNRISVTPDLLRKVGKIRVLCVGLEKRAIVEKFKRNPEQILAARVLAVCPDVEVWYAKKGITQ